MPVSGSPGVLIDAPAGVHVIDIRLVRPRTQPDVAREVTPSAVPTREPHQLDIVDYNDYCGIVKSMSDHTTRRYHSPRRVQQAEATRQAIIQAARTLFARHGYQATAIQSIAQEAGVAVPTLYVTFGSKAAILSALIKSAGADDDIRAIANAAMAETDPWRQLPLAARVVRSIQERDADITDLLWQAGGGDPDLAAAWRQSHQQQLSRLGEIVGALAQKGALKSELSVESATDILWILGSPEVYRLLVRERGWTPQHYEDWFGQTATTLLLRDA